MVYAIFSSDYSWIKQFTFYATNTLDTLITNIMDSIFEKVVSFFVAKHDIAVIKPISAMCFYGDFDIFIIMSTSLLAQSLLVL